MTLQTAPPPAAPTSGAGYAARRGARQILGRALLLGSAAGLAVYHAFLLWDRVASLKLLEPAIALRWGAAALLWLGLARMWRAGVPLLAGREALAVWTLVALLHAGMVPGVGAEAATLAEVEAAFGLAVSLSALLWLLAADGTSRTLEPRGAPRRLSPAPTPAFLAAYLAILSPRAPPAA